MDRPEEEHLPRPDASLGELRQSLQECHAEYLRFVENRTRDQLSERLTYSESGSLTASVAEVMLQALMHGQHHRGQNALRLRRLGVDPPMTDYIAWVLTGKPAPTW